VLEIDIDPVVKLPPPSACALPTVWPLSVMATCSSLPNPLPVKSIEVPPRTVVLAGMSCAVDDALPIAPDPLLLLRLPPLPLERP